MVHDEVGGTFDQYIVLGPILLQGVRLSHYLDMTFVCKVMTAKQSLKQRLVFFFGFFLLIPLRVVSTVQCCKLAHTTCAFGIGAAKLICGPKKNYAPKNLRNCILFFIFIFFFLVKFSVFLVRIFYFFRFDHLY